MKSAEARLQAMGMFHTTAIRERFNIRIMGLGLKGIPEEDQEVDLVADDLGADLLVAAKRTTLKHVDLKSKELFQGLARRAGGVHFVVRQEITELAH